MFGRSRREREKALDRMLQTRSDAWAEVGLDINIDQHVVRNAARWLVFEFFLLILVIVGKSAALHHISKLWHQHPPQHWIVSATVVKIVAMFAVLGIGWLVSRDISRVTPAFFRRMDPATAGTVEFLTRFLAVIVTVLGALAVGGISFKALAVGGAFTAVVLGLAAQQPLGNLFAGMVLLTARPFRLGERVRLRAGTLGGQAEGIVSSLGLLYTTLAVGDDRMMIPNTNVLGAVVVPITEPDPVDVKVTLTAGILPSHVHALLQQNLVVPTRGEPSVVLEEIDGTQVIIRVQAIPLRHSDGIRLADEIVASLTSLSGEQQTVES
jgi:small conductance mechanosensitive channel